MVIQPHDIDLYKGLVDTFNNCETEASARWIISFFQTKNRCWAIGFTFDEINDFYHKIGDSLATFCFNRLIDIYVIERDGTFFVTDKFIAKCYAATV